MNLFNFTLNNVLIAAPFVKKQDCTKANKHRGTKHYTI